MTICQKQKRAEAVKVWLHTWDQYEIHALSHRQCAQRLHVRNTAANDSVLASGGQPLPWCITPSAPKTKCKCDSYAGM